jgi:hypothetical protein
MFKEIKVGDTVLAIRTIQTGGLRQESFFVPIAVSRVTPKQFVLDNGQRYWKGDGSTVGDSYQRCYRVDNGYYKDQSAELEKRKEQVRKCSSISHLISNLNKADFLDLDNENQDEILVLLGKIKKLSK